MQNDVFLIKTVSKVANLQVMLIFAFFIGLIDVVAINNKIATKGFRVFIYLTSECAKTLYL